MIVMGLSIRKGPCFLLLISVFCGIIPICLRIEVLGINFGEKETFAMNITFYLLGAAFVLLSGLMAFYLMWSFQKTTVFRKLARGSRKGEWLLSFLLLVLLTAVLTWSLSAINAVVCLLHLALFWLLCDGLFAILRRWRSFHPACKGALALLLTVSYLAVGWYLAHHAARTEYSLFTDKEVEPLRVVQISDVHMGAIFDAEGFQERLRLVQEEEPDLLVITGDFVDDSTSREDLLAACEALGEVQTTYGTYFVYGNHDKGYRSAEHRGWSAQELASGLEAAGVTILEDEIVLIGEHYALIGRKDFSEHTRAEMGELAAGLEERYTIVLDHQPRDYAAQTAAGVDLVLSGHTHGGQMLPINRVGEWMGVNCRTYGYERRESTDFIVNSGIGAWELPFKTGCKSEYGAIEIASK